MCPEHQKVTVSIRVQQKFLRINLSSYPGLETNPHLLQVPIKHDDLVLALVSWLLTRKMKSPDENCDCAMFFDKQNFVDNNGFCKSAGQTGCAQ